MRYIATVSIVFMLLLPTVSRAQGLTEAQMSYNRGSQYFAAEDYERALEWFMDAIARNPSFAEAYAGRGWVYCAQENYELALKSFDTAIALAPWLTRAYYGRGTVYVQMEQWDKAKYDFIKAILADPELGRDVLSWIFDEIKDMSERLERYEDK